MSLHFLVMLFMRIPLAVVFAVAGILKYRNQPAFRQTLYEFGLPRSITGALALFLPAAEITVATLLLVGDPVRCGSIGALLLLLAFTAAISFNLLKGRRPQCQCFGQISSQPIGWLTCVRNLFLMALGGICLIPQGRWGDGAGHALHIQFAVAGLAVSLVVALALIGEGWVILLLARQQGRLIRRVEDLEKRLTWSGEVVNEERAKPAVNGIAVGSKAPEFLLPTASGSMISLQDLLEPGLPVALIFANPNCNACNALVPQVASWQTGKAVSLTIAVISEGNAEANIKKFAPYGLKNILLQEKREIATSYHVNLTPSALIISADGEIGSPIYAGPEAIAALVERIGGVGPQTRDQLRAADTLPSARDNTHALALGERLPFTSLIDLDGNHIDVTGSKINTLVLFWNPSCSFCIRMLPELKLWEREDSSGAAEILVIASGSEQANRDLGLRSPVVLDQGGRLKRALSVPGTPSAFLLDAEGTVASAMMVGADAIRGLTLVTHGGIDPIESGSFSVETSSVLR